MKSCRPHCFVLSVLFVVHFSLGWLKSPDGADIIIVALPVEVVPNTIIEVQAIGTV